MQIFVSYFIFELKFHHKKRKKQIVTGVCHGARTVYIKHASIILKVPNGTLYLLRDIECVPLGNIDKTQL